MLYGYDPGGVRPVGGLRWKSGANESAGGAEYESKKLFESYERNKMRIYV